MAKQTEQTGRPKPIRHRISEYGGIKWGGRGVLELIKIMVDGVLLAKEWNVNIVFSSYICAVFGLKDKYRFHQS